jgi:hypothetical protein
VGEKKRVDFLQFAVRVDVHLNVRDGQTPGHWVAALSVRINVLTAAA